MLAAVDLVTMGPAEDDVCALVAVYVVVVVPAVQLVVAVGRQDRVVPTPP